ncbi:MAG: hypothetical protein GF317_09890, partial [Candidatus Lokiarchaeota archaeon]|nr:hypothetical protein [Candidatus Lokiarchaeota archaeon]MBD3199995.1 hypothetical protein [Candidatus Lokiarchaeota archaeon]
MVYFLIKNIIIGIDGGSFNFILPLIRTNTLPNFQKILQNGFKGNLNVTTPPVTVPSWPCLFSGLSVEELGIDRFYRSSFGIFSSSYWASKSIFSVKGLRSFCLNIPSSYPAWNIEGEMITGMISPNINKKMVYPEHVFDLIRNDWIIDGTSIDE